MTLQEVHYKGTRGSTNFKGQYFVTKDIDHVVDGIDPRKDLRNHSEGFSWGYGGSGPAQLALALLSDALPNDVKLPRSFGEKSARNITDHDIVIEDFYERFKHEFVSKFKPEGWTMNRSTILSWLDKAIRQQWAVSLRILSETCARSAVRDGNATVFLLNTRSDGSQWCTKCNRNWDLDEAKVLNGECPACSFTDVYMLNNLYGSGQEVHIGPRK